MKKQLKKNKGNVILLVLISLIIGASNTNNDILYDLNIIKIINDNSSQGDGILDSLKISYKIKKFSRNKEIKTIKVLQFSVFKNKTPIFSCIQSFPGITKNCYPSIEPFIYADSCYKQGGNKNNYFKFNIRDRKVSLSVPLKNKAIMSNDTIVIKIRMMFAGVGYSNEIVKIIK